MKYFEGSAQARADLINLLIDEPAILANEELKTLRALASEPSPVDATVRAVELVYAVVDEGGKVPAALKEWAAASAVMQSGHGFHGMNQGERGEKLAKVLRGQKIADKDKPRAKERTLGDNPPAPAA